MIFEKAAKVKGADPKGLCNDPDDEKFLSAAVSGKAQYIVTKNKKHFQRDLTSVKIVNVREFLNKLEQWIENSSFWGKNGVPFF